jgi:quinol monooxygenase YgiN
LRGGFSPPGRRGDLEDAEECQSRAEVCGNADIAAEIDAGKIARMMGSTKIMGSVKETPAMVGGLKIVVAKAGHEREFESMFEELRKIMREKEPGCLLYSLLRSRTNSRSYIVHEQYRDPAALEAHQGSAHGKIYFPRMRAILESVTVEYFDGVVS